MFLIGTRLGVTSAMDNRRKDKVISDLKSPPSEAPRAP